MASKSDSIVPVLLLAGLAVFLLYQRQLVGGVTGKTNTAAIRTSADAKIKAVGDAVSGFITYLGGVSGNNGNWSNAKPTEAALDQVIEAAKAYDKAYGGITGTDGDPYGDWS